MKNKHAWESTAKLSGSADADTDGPTLHVCWSTSSCSPLPPVDPSRPPSDEPCCDDDKEEEEAESGGSQDTETSSPGAPRIQTVALVVSCPIMCGFVVRTWAAWAIMYYSVVRTVNRPVKRCEDTETHL